MTPAELEIIALLKEVRDGVNALREAMEAHERPEPVALKLHDREALAKLLPVLGAQFGAERFSVWELQDIAERPGLVGSDMKLALAGASPQKIGLLLKRAADSNGVGGWQVVRAGQDGSGALWGVRELTAGALPFTPGRKRGVISA